MICDTGADVLAMKFESPLYAAVIECMSTVSDAVTSVACPNPFTATVASTALPSVNVIVPVAVPAPGHTAFTTAVNVTAVPMLDGFKLDATVVEVFALFTVWVPAGEVLALKLFVAPYAAVIACRPATSPDVVNVATPETFNVLVPMTVTPS